ncbi:hypothetical protein BDW68DRAFT_111596 [Aspergillus falconensis]
MGGRQSTKHPGPWQRDAAPHAGYIDQPSLVNCLRRLTLSPPFTFLPTLSSVPAFLVFGICLVPYVYPVHALLWVNSGILPLLPLPSPASPEPHFHPKRFLDLDANIIACDF